MIKLSHQSCDNSLGTGAAEYGRYIGYCADLRLLVAVLAWDYRLLVRQFLREDHLEAFLYAHVAESLADDICQRAVEGLGDICQPYLGGIELSSGSHR